MLAANGRRGRDYGLLTGGVGIGGRDGKVTGAEQGFEGAEEDDLKPGLGLE